MNSGQSGDHDDKPAYTKELNELAEEAAREIRQRADKEREAAEKHADEAAESVRRAIRDQARRLAETTLIAGSGESAADKSSKKKAGKKKAAKKKKNKKSAGSGQRASKSSQ